MSTAPQFDPEAARLRLGPAAVAAIARHVADAPPLSAEQRMQLRAVFLSARSTAAPAGQRPVHRAA
ncbi:hypothetical protein [Streptomyces niveus]|uniref:hypothetical protein n=1 Tax=Streptomyces niveus TaxID=193462 RepID=UPI00386EDB89